MRIFRKELLQRIDEIKESPQNFCNKWDQSKEHELLKIKIFKEHAPIIEQREEDNNN